jgi:hypothetical protein
VRCPESLLRLEEKVVFYGCSLLGWSPLWLDSKLTGHQGDEMTGTTLTSVLKIQLAQLTLCTVYIG